VPGTPERKPGKDRARNTGETTSPEAENPDEPKIDQARLEAYRNHPGSQPRGKGKIGASAEYMNAIRMRRDEMAKIDPSKKGGRPRTKFSKAEATEHALERLEPLALKVLERQLKSPDERVRQSAAVKILEWKRGKPGQTLKVDSEAVHTIKYETVAFGKIPPPMDLELSPEMVFELEAGESDEGFGSEDD